MSASLNHSPTVPASALAASWLRQLHQLQQLREQQADAPEQFRWLIQCRILQFLFNCYGSDPTLSEPTPTRFPLHPFEVPSSPVATPPRSSYVLGHYLTRISQGNAEAHAQRQQHVTADQNEPLTRFEKSLQDFVAFLNKPIF